MNEKAPLLSGTGAEPYTNVKSPPGWRMIPKRISSAFIGTIRIVIATITAPARYLVACFYDDEGNFSVLMPIYKLGGNASRRKRRASPQAIMTSSESDTDGSSLEKEGRPGNRKHRRLSSGSSSSTAVQTDSEFDQRDSVSAHTRSKASLSQGEEISPARRSIRIKLYNEDALKQRKNRKAAASSSKSGQMDPQSAFEAAAASLKSPIGAATATRMTRYPRTPVPPRPIVPKRQPSYTAMLPFQGAPHQKTLIIDLDETLIHSQSKGGRYTTGHMVEVKMQNPIGAGGVTFPPQVPILYYVHKRPYCDEFLRKVSQHLLWTATNKPDDNNRLRNGTISLFSQRQYKSMQTRS